MSPYIHYPKALNYIDLIKKNSLYIILVLIFIITYQSYSNKDSNTSNQHSSFRINNDIIHSLTRHRDCSIPSIETINNNNIQSGGKWFQTYWEPCIACSNEERIGRIGDGGKWICNPQTMLKHNNCLVLSIGSGNHFDFEYELINRYGCHVHIFDHTSSPPIPSPSTFQQCDQKCFKKFHFHRFGLDLYTNISKNMLSLTDMIYIVTGATTPISTDSTTSTIHTTHTATYSNNMNILAHNIHTSSTSYAEYNNTADGTNDAYTPHTSNMYSRNLITTPNTPTTPTNTLNMIDILKIDCEGCEFTAFCSDTHTNSNTRTNSKSNTYSNSNDSSNNSNDVTYTNLLLLSKYIKQISIEIHWGHFFYTHPNTYSLWALWTQVSGSAGFEPFHKVCIHVKLYTLI